MPSHAGPLAQQVADGAPVCLRCGGVVPVPFDVCHRCGGRVLVGDLDGADFSVEAGPVASQRFRDEAVGKVRAVAEGVDAAAASRALQAGRVRVVEGLARDTAEALRDALGPRETAAPVAEGATPPVGWGGALAKGLPVWGFAAGAVLGVAVHPLGWALGVLAAAALAYRNAQRPMPVLGTAPVGPLVDPGLRRAVLSYVEARERVDGEDARRALEATADAIVQGAAALADPDAVEPFGDLTETMNGQLTRAFEGLAAWAQRGGAGEAELARIAEEAGVSRAVSPVASSAVSVDALDAPGDGALAPDDPLSQAIEELAQRDG